MDSQQLRWSNLKVGIVLMIGLIIFVFIVSIVGTEQNIFTSTYTVKLFVTNVHGLVNGAMVTLGGLKIGYVTDLQFQTRDSVNGVEVTATLLSKYRASVTSSTMAQIKTIGLLGDKYIDLSIGNRNEPPVAENTFIPIIESFDIETAGPQFKSALADFTELMGSARRIAASVEKGEGSLGKLVKRNDVALGMERFLASLNGVMSAVEKKRGLLGALVYDDSLSRGVSEVSSNLRSITGQIRKGQGTMGKLIMEDDLYRHLSSFTSRADTLMAKAASDSSNVSKFIGDGRFYTQMNSLMKDLNLFLIDLKEHPERYVHFSVF
ncbi:MAG TPA: MlaD family protein [Bacteroidota bacterium]|jgi:phospholipid/cholesterol/gamma-HCH transport system substrate-binding protein